MSSSSSVLDQKALVIGLIAQFFGTRLGIRNHADFMRNMGMPSLIGMTKWDSLRNGLRSTYSDNDAFVSFVQALVYNHKLGSDEQAELNIYLDLIGYELKSGRIVSRPQKLKTAAAVSGSAFAREAGDMARVYMILFVLENELRTFIMDKLSKVKGQESNRLVPSNLRDKWQLRKKAEEESPWHEIHPAELVSYANFRDLREIINKNWSLFESYFRDRSGVIGRLGELEIPRNAIAHNRLLAASEVDRLVMLSEDILKCIKPSENPQDSAAQDE